MRKFAVPILLGVFILAIFIGISLTNKQGTTQNDAGSAESASNDTPSQGETVSVEPVDAEDTETIENADERSRVNNAYRIDIEGVSYEIGTSTVKEFVNNGWEMLDEKELDYYVMSKDGKNLYLLLDSPESGIEDAVVTGMQFDITVYPDTYADVVVSDSIRLTDSIEDVTPMLGEPDSNVTMDDIGVAVHSYDGDSQLELSLTFENNVLTRILLFKGSTLTVEPAD